MTDFHLAKNKIENPVVSLFPINAICDGYFQGWPRLTLEMIR
jgi:hypothetical protein